MMKRIRPVPAKVPAPGQNLDSLRQAALANPRDEAIVLHLAWALYAEHGFAESETSFGQCASLAPDDPEGPQGLARAALAFQQEYDFDLIKVTPASSFSVRDWGVTDVWEGDAEGVRRYITRAIAAPRDWERLADLNVRRGALGAQLG